MKIYVALKYVCLQSSKDMFLCRVIKWSFFLLAGETSAGKSTLINLLIEKTVLVTSNTASTGTITRIRNSKELGLKCYSEDQLLEKHGNIQDIKTLKSVIKKFTGIKNSEKDLKAINYVDVYLPVPFLKVKY